jgi:3-phenylpropionate/trans-cinnamate dioxygenase ferredoxin subunit
LKEVTMPYVVAGPVAEVENGQMKAVKVGGREILLARVENTVYAASDICPHMGGRLSRGALKGTVVTCPRHASQFDLRDGRVVRWTVWSGIKLAISKMFRSPRPLKTYPAKVEGDQILVAID